MTTAPPRCRCSSTGSRASATDAALPQGGQRRNAPCPPLSEIAGNSWWARGACHRGAHSRARVPLPTPLFCTDLSAARKDNIPRGVVARQPPAARRQKQQLYACKENPVRPADPLHQASGVTENRFAAPIHLFIGEEWRKERNDECTTAASTAAAKGRAGRFGDSLLAASKTGIPTAAAGMPCSAPMNRAIKRSNSESA